MRRRGNVFVIFVVCVLLCILLIFFSKGSFLQGLHGVLEDITLPMQRMMHGMVAGSLDEVTRLREENAALSAQLAHDQELKKENQALHDQFATALLPTKQLLPASIIGSPAFIPSVSKVDQFIIDKGTSEGAKKGAVVV